VLCNRYISKCKNPKINYLTHNYASKDDIGTLELVPNTGTAHTSQLPSAAHYKNSSSQPRQRTAGAVRLVIQGLIDTTADEKIQTVPTEPPWMPPFLPKPASLGSQRSAGWKTTFSPQKGGAQPPYSPSEEARGGSKTGLMSLILFYY
jgi:hypothetical protein